MTIDDSTPLPKAAPARAAARVTAGYLLLTAPLLPLGGGDAARFALAALHLALAAGLLELDRRRARGAGRGLRVLADWLPLLLVPVLYAELPLLMEALPRPVRYYDPLVSRFEAALFGGQPAFDWAGAWPITVLSEALHACYVSYYLLIYVPPLLLYVGLTGSHPPHAHPRAAFHETVLALALSFLVCFAIFVVLPVQGPRYLGVPRGVPEGPIRELVLTILERGSSRGAAFPSSHVAVAVTQAALALRHQRRVGLWVAAVTIGLGAGAVYGGFHYAVDALAGAAVGVAVVPLARRLGSGVQGA